MPVYAATGWIILDDLVTIETEGGDLEIADPEEAARGSHPVVSVRKGFSGLGESGEMAISWSEAVMAKRMGTGILSRDLKRMASMGWSGRGFFQGKRLTPISILLYLRHQPRKLALVSFAPKKLENSTPTLKGMISTPPSS